MKLDLEALKTQANRDGLRPERAVALIDELTEARRERDTLKEAASFYVKELQEKAANARAAAFEEAARHLGGAKVLVGRDMQKEFRALAPLPPSVACVPVETLERVRSACDAMVNSRRYEEHEWNVMMTERRECMNNLRAALAALTKVKP